MYGSIPYSQAEYIANPSYRHEATMEILFGELRPTTIVKRQSRDSVIRNDFGYGDNRRRNHVSPFYDFGRGPYSRYRGLFGYTGGYQPLFYNYSQP